MKTIGMEKEARRSHSADRQNCNQSRCAVVGVDHAATLMHGNFSISGVLSITWPRQGSVITAAN